MNPRLDALTDRQRLDVVALKSALPKHHRQPGQVDPIGELLAADVYEVEFSDNQGQTLPG